MNTIRSLSVALVISLSAFAIPLSAEPDKSKTNELSQLINQMYAADSETRYHAIQKIEQMGPKAEAAVPHLIDSMVFDDVNIVVALEALASIGPKASTAIPKMLEILNENNVDTMVADRIFLALGSMGSLAQNAYPNILKKLEYAFSYANNRERWLLLDSALKALIKIGPGNTNAIPQTLFTFYKDLKRNAEEREKEKYGFSPTDDTSIDYQYKFSLLARLLAQYGEQALPYLSEMMAMRQPQVEKEAILALGHVAKTSQKAASELATRILSIKHNTFVDGSSRDLLEQFNIKDTYLNSLVTTSRHDILRAYDADRHQTMVSYVLEAITTAGIAFKQYSQLLIPFLLSQSTDERHLAAIALGAVLKGSGDNAAVITALKQSALDNYIRVQNASIAAISNIMGQQAMMASLKPEQDITMVISIWALVNNLNAITTDKYPQIKTAFEAQLATKSRAIQMQASRGLVALIEASKAKNYDLGSLTENAQNALETLTQQKTDIHLAAAAIKAMNAAGQKKILNWAQFDLDIKAKKDSFANRTKREQSLEIMLEYAEQKFDETLSIFLSSLGDITLDDHLIRALVLLHNRGLDVKTQLIKALATKEAETSFLQDMDKDLTDEEIDKMLEISDEDEELSDVDIDEPLDESNEGNNQYTMVDVNLYDKENRKMNQLLLYYRISSEPLSNDQAKVLVDAIEELGALNKFTFKELLREPNWSEEVMKALEAKIKVPTETGLNSESEKLQLYLLAMMGSKGTNKIDSVKAYLKTDPYLISSPIDRIAKVGLKALTAIDVQYKSTDDVLALLNHSDDFAYPMYHIFKHKAVLQAGANLYATRYFAKGTAGNDKVLAYLNKFIEPFDHGLPASVISHMTETVWAIGKLKHKDTTKHLAALLTNKWIREHSDVHKQNLYANVAWALGRLGADAKDAAGAIAEHLKAVSQEDSDNIYLRYQLMLIAALAQIGTLPEEYQSMMIELLGHEQPLIAKATKAALVKLKIAH